MNTFNDIFLLFPYTQATKTWLISTDSYERLERLSKNCFKNAFFIIFFLKSAIYFHAILLLSFLVFSVLFCIVEVYQILFSHYSVPFLIVCRFVQKSNLHFFFTGPFFQVVWFSNLSFHFLQILCFLTFKNNFISFVYHIRNLSFWENLPLLHFYNCLCDWRLREAFVYFQMALRKISVLLSWSFSISFSNTEEAHLKVPLPLFVNFLPITYHHFSIIL